MDSSDNASKADQNAKKQIENGEISLGAYLYDDFKRINATASDNMTVIDTPQLKEQMITKTKSSRLATKLGGRTK
jgi:hypothetical protein